MTFKSVFFLWICLFLNSCSFEDHPQFNGYVEGENIYLASPFYGVLQKILIQRGQHVTKGELLFALDANPQSMTIAQVQGELLQAQNTLADLRKPKRPQEISAIQAQIEQAASQVTLAQLRVSRFQKLVEKMASDRDSLDAALANLQVQQNLKLQYESNLALAKLGSREEQIAAQQSQVDALTAKLAQAKWELRQKTIAAPASGTIFDTYYRVGDFIAAQQPVLSLLTPENIRIEFFVPLTYLAKLKVGQKVSFDCEGCEKNNGARINYIAPDAEYLPPLVYSRDNYSKLVFRIQARIDKPELFKPGQPILVTL